MAPASSRPLFSYENLVHAIAGSAGAVTAMSAFYPLDTIRAILQVDEKRKAKNSFAMLMELAREDGIFSLYKGLLPVLISVCASNFVYFYTFHGLKALPGIAQKNQTALRDLGLACIAGIINVLTTTPLWVVTTRLKLQGTKFHSEEMRDTHHPSYNGIIDGLIKVAKNEGVAGLWSSTLPSLILVSNPAIHFMVYELLKRRMQDIYKTKDLNAAIYFTIGAAAKAVATFLTYPVQIIQAKFRYENANKSNNQTTIKQMILYLLRTQGVQGLYKGLEAKMLQTVLTAALMFLCYEKIAASVFKLLK